MVSEAIRSSHLKGHIFFLVGACPQPSALGILLHTILSPSETIFSLPVGTPMIRARCLCIGSSVVVMGGGLADGVSGSTDEVITRVCGNDVVVGKGAVIVVGEMALLTSDNDDDDNDDCALPQPM